MPSNFTFLQAEPQFRDFADVAVEAERAMAFSPETAAIYARKALETAVVWVYEHDEALRLPERPQVSSLIHDEAFREIIEPELFPLLKYVIRMGNFAVHTASHMGRAEALLSLKDLFAFLSWVAYCYATSYEERTFNEALVPTAGADMPIMCCTARTSGRSPSSRRSAPRGRRLFLAGRSRAAHG